MSERKVSTDALETLGTIHGAPQHRDAIHLAVEPVVAGEALAPGQHITVSEGLATKAEEGKGLGIVDPFLPAPGVSKGDRFWFVMYPRIVRSLRHVWTHPAFDYKEGTPRHRTASEILLDRVAENAGLTRAALIEGANDFLDHGDYMIQGGRWEGFSIPDGFWSAFEAVTGREVGDDPGNFFSCSC